LAEESFMEKIPLKKEAALVGAFEDLEGPMAWRERFGHLSGGG
jgi:hypothetical protein